MCDHCLEEEKTDLATESIRSILIAVRTVDLEVQRRAVP